MQDKRITDAGNFPKVILLDTISYCNLSCLLCGYRIMTRKKGKMSMALYRKLIDEIADKDKKARVWMVFVGEALILRYQLYWEILYAKRKGLEDVVLNSNGCLLDKDTSIALIESGLDAIYVGVDAFTVETYNKLRVGGNYNEVVANVNTLLALKQKMGVTKPDVFVQFVKTKDNESEADDFRNYWTAQGANVKIRPQVTWAGTVESWKVKPIKRYPCYWAMRTINICWDGRVVLCSVDYDAKFVAGNVSQNSIQDVWLGSFKNIRNANLQSDYKALPSFCRDCSDWQMASAEYY